MHNVFVCTTFFTVRYHLDLCRNVFGEGVYPDVFMTNLYYGGTRIDGSYLYPAFTISILEIRCFAIISLSVPIKCYTHWFVCHTYICAVGAAGLVGVSANGPREYYCCFACLLQYFYSPCFFWCSINYLQPPELCLQMALKIPGVTHPNRNHRKIVSPLKLYLLHCWFISVAIASCSIYLQYNSQMFSALWFYAVPSYIIKCSNCGHGTDLRGCPQSPFRIEGRPKHFALDKACCDFSTVYWCCYLWRQFHFENQENTFSSIFLLLHYNLHMFRWALFLIRWKFSHVQHCSGDPSNCTSPQAVDIVREKIVKHIDLWLSQCQEPSKAGYGFLAGSHSAQATLNCDAV
jgi:hypothetical protein